jgi:hypothetical protein
MFGSKRRKQRNEYLARIRNYVKVLEERLLKDKSFILNDSQCVGNLGADPALLAGRVEMFLDTCQAIQSVWIGTEDALSKKLITVAEAEEIRMPISLFMVDCFQECRISVEWIVHHAVNTEEDELFRGYVDDRLNEVRSSWASLWIIRFFAVEL